jgi:hypothetical protein
VFQLCAISHTLSIRLCRAEFTCNRLKASVPLLSVQLSHRCKHAVGRHFDALSSVALQAGDVVIALALRVILGLLGMVYSAPLYSWARKLVGLGVSARSRALSSKPRVQRAPEGTGRLCWKA